MKSFGITQKGKK